LADGTKLRVRDGAGDGFDYVGALTYTPQGLESAAFAGGRIITGEADYQEINYFVTDHLGSVRAVVRGAAAGAGVPPHGPGAAAAAVVQRTDYYPFGAAHVRPLYPASTTRHAFNGKEKQVTGNLKWQDFGFRQYDPAAVRWLSLDPLASDYTPFSPYIFTLNNPIIYIDPDGRMTDWYLDTNAEEIVNIEGSKDLSTQGLVHLAADNATMGEMRDALAEAGYEQWGGMTVGEKGKMMMDIFDPGNIGTILGLASFQSGAVRQLGQRAMGKMGTLGTVGAKPASQGFPSFAAFKKAMGPAGEGQAWHHIVEQTPGNVAKFGANTIHNTGNMVKLPHGAGMMHNQISGYYSSVRPFTDGQTVRQWLSNQSYQAQYDFGIQTMQKFGWTP
jgi:RHS repeat-associated protein